MKAEFFDIEGTYHREIENITLNDIDALLNEAREKGGAGSVSLVISRSSKDYINIDYVGKDEYLFQTDRLEKVGNFWQRLIQYPRITKIVKGHSEARVVIKKYISSDRSEFETLYS